jgi:hypothetical protein
VADQGTATVTLSADPNAGPSGSDDTLG